MEYWNKIKELSEKKNSNRDTKEEKIEKIIKLINKMEDVVIEGVPKELIKYYSRGIKLTRIITLPSDSDIQFAECREEIRTQMETIQVNIIN